MMNELHALRVEYQMIYAQLRNATLMGRCTQGIQVALDEVSKKLTAAAQLRKRIEAANA